MRQGHENMRLPRVERARLLIRLADAKQFTGTHRVLQALYPLHFVLAYTGNVLTGYFRADTAVQS
jgi:hypothetical protein